MEHVLNAYLQDRKDIHLAVGVDMGTILVTQLGKKGAREVVCLGPQVTSAEGLQLHSVGREIRISKALYETIGDESLKRQFVKDDQGAYVAKGLTFPKLDELEEAEAARTGMLAAGASSQRLKIEVPGSQRPTFRVSPKPWWSG
jgi:class 3 adenylate cyclase